MTAAGTLTAEDLYRRFGPIPLRRVRLHPYPATEADVLELHRRDSRLYELADGLLVEKDMGFAEGFLALRIGRKLGDYVESIDAGVVNGADGMMRLAPGLVRIPDVSFCRWDQFPNREVQLTPIPDLHPDLAVEVLSRGNTVAEMDAKLADYFASGATVVWLVDPADRTVLVYTTSSRESPTRLTAADTLTGGPLLPGFTLPVAGLFAGLAAE
jgi:Uma2 family endonuclease